MEIRKSIIDINKIRNNYLNLSRNSKTAILKFKASSDIGFGHLSRMITLANFLRGGGKNVVCAINDFDYAKKRLKYEKLQYEVNGFETDEEFVGYLIDKHEPDLVLVDERYSYGKEFLKEWQRKTKFIAIDFIGKDYCLIDKVIIPNVHFQPGEHFDCDNIVWGWDWVLISKEVLELKPKENLPNRINTIVVTTGGSDPKGVLFYILNWLKCMDKDVLVLIGDSFKYIDRIRNLNLPGNFRVEAYHPAKLLKGDVAVVTFGVSVYELVYLNIPVFCVGHTEESTRSCEVLAKRCKLVKNLGYFENCLGEKRLELDGFERVVCE